MTFIFAEEWMNISVEYPVYSCEFSVEHYSDALYAKFGIPDLERMDKAVTKRRAEYLAGRLCAAKCLSELGLSNHSVSVGENRSPVWPAGVIGSISHCEGLAIATAFNQQGHIGVGIDVESIVKPETVSTISRQIVNEHEAKLIQKQGSICPRLFTAVFSAKESFFKAAYPTVKRYFDFYAVSLLEINHERELLHFTINEGLNSPELQPGREFVASFRYLPNSRVITQILLT